MFKKRRLLLGVIDELNRLNRFDPLTLMKVMFLLTKQKSPQFSTYGYYAYKYGPFSSELYSDMRLLVKQELLEENLEENLEQNLEEKLAPGTNFKSFSVSKIGKQEIQLLPSEKTFINVLLKKYPTTSSLIDYIYETFPEYTINSVRKHVPIPYPLDNTPCFFLIGYEMRNIDDFLQELIKRNIDTLVDVRFTPHSMKYMFNKTRLSNSLEKVNIKYIHIPQLGIEGEKRKNLDTKADYEALFLEYRVDIPSKKTILDELIKIGEKKRIALMCYERDYHSCHRREIGRYLKNHNNKVKIIS